jgi:hypothetical protein
MSSKIINLVLICTNVKHSKSVDEFIRLTNNSSRSTCDVRITKHESLANYWIRLSIALNAVARLSFLAIPNVLTSSITS